MKVYYRQRRSPYFPSPQPQPKRGGLGRLLLLLLLLWLAWVGIRGLWRLIGSGSVPQTAALTVEGNSDVDVSYEGNAFQAAETATKLQPGDAVRTGPDSYAVLRLADGTLLRLDAQTEALLTVSEAADEEMRLDIALREGSAWVLTPEAESGTVVRGITVGELTYRLPTNTETLVSPTGAVVYAADGAGVEVLRDGEMALTLGEGQQLHLPASAPPDDLARLRSAFNLAALQNTFVRQSRRLLAAGEGETSEGEDTGGLLTIQSPRHNEKVTGSAVRLRGRADASVREVRVNGSAIPLAADGSFTRDIPLLSEGTFDLHVAALDEAGSILAETTRTVERQSQASSIASATGPRPEVTAPVKTGETHSTTEAEVVIRGTVPSGTQQVWVNDYQLKLFDPTKSTFSYLARLDLGNMKPGTNTYDVVAVDASGRRSQPARITVQHGNQVPPPATGGASSAASSAPRLRNAPLTPGALKVTAPAANATVTGTGFLLEGTTSRDTASIEVNDYRLQLFKPYGGYWNYIASVGFQNLKPGENTYVIVARNAEGQVLDRLEHTVTYQP